jgi:MFS family permease
MTPLSHYQTPRILDHIAVILLLIKIQLYALRFFVGLLESCSFPGYAALLGSWYGPTQLAKRVALFEQSSAIASMFSGYLQAALYTGMNGKAGLKGWQWLFIFDAIISIPIAVWGYFAIPDMPGNTRAFWLKKKVCPFYFTYGRDCMLGRFQVLGF